MSLESDVFAALNGATAAADRVFPSVLKQGVTLPALTYQRIDTPRSHTHGERGGLARPRVQVTCWAETHAAALALAAEVLAVMATFPKALSDTELDDYEPETGRHRRIVDFLIWSNE